MKRILSGFLFGACMVFISGGATANGATVALLMQQQNKKAEEQNAFYQALKPSSPNIINDGFSEYPNFFKIGPETKFCTKEEVVFEQACYTEFKESEGVIDRVKMKDRRDGFSAQEMLDMDYGKNRVAYVGMGVITRPFNISRSQYYDAMIVYYKIIDDKKDME